VDGELVVGPRFGEEGEGADLGVVVLDVGRDQVVLGEEPLEEGAVDAGGESRIRGLALVGAC
jgi:hypothetical protein